MSEPNTRGIIEYRCRRCGEIYSNLSSPDIHASLAWPSLGIDLNNDVTHHAQAARLYDIHTCGKGGMGVADLVGATPHEQAKEDGPGNDANAADGA